MARPKFKSAIPPGSTSLTQTPEEVKKNKSFTNLVTGVSEGKYFSKKDIPILTDKNVENTSIQAKPNLSDNEEGGLTGTNNTLNIEANAKVPNVNKNDVTAAQPSKSILPDVDIFSGIQNVANAVTQRLGKIPKFVNQGQGEPAPIQNTGNQVDQQQQTDIISELDRVGKKQKNIDLAEAGFNLATVVGEALRKPTAPYQAPLLGYTLQPNVRDIILNQSQQDIAGETAAMLRFMQENGIVSPGSALLANTLDAKNKANAIATEGQNQVNAQNAQIINETNAKNEIARTDAANKSADRQLQLNSMSGQIMGQGMSNIFGILTDMNRNDIEKAKVKELLDSNANNQFPLWASAMIDRFVPGYYSSETQKQRGYMNPYNQY